MPIEYRQINETQLRAFYAAEATSYTSAPPSPDDEEALRQAFDFSRSFAAFDGRQIVGGACHLDMDLSVPGGSVPAGPVTNVFVVPSHRRQGIVTELMRRQFARMREEGMVVAALHAAESSIYSRFGYGSAAPTEVIDIEKPHARFASPVSPAGKFRLLDDREAMLILPRIYEDYREITPGLLSRNQAWWQLRLRKPGRKEGSPDWVKAVYERDGERRGYVIYNATHNWQNAVPMNRLNVVEMAANDPEAYAAIWHYIFSVDLIKEISAYAGLNPPIWWMLADPRRLTRRTRDGLWVRFVDALAALAERKYAANGVVTIELEDPFCPWNSGTYRVESDDGESACERVDGPGGIVVSASALASCYLGANDFNTLAAAGLAEERAPGALARASAMFRWHTSPMTSAPEPLS